MLFYLVSMSFVWVSTFLHHVYIYALNVIDIVSDRSYTEVNNGKCEKCTIYVYPLFLCVCCLLFAFLYAVRVSVFGNKLKSVIKLNMDGKWNILLLMRGICLRYYIHVRMFYIERAHPLLRATFFFVLTQDEAFAGMTNRSVGRVAMKMNVMW